LTIIYVYVNICVLLNKQKMKNLENNPDNDKDPRVKFRKLINAAVNNASSLLNAKLTEKDLEARLEEIGANDDRLMRITKMFVRSKAEFLKMIDPDRSYLDESIVFNHALKDVLNDFENESMSPDALINRLTEFSFVSTQLPESQKDLLRQVFAKDFKGMWHEQAFENLLCRSVGVKMRMGQTSLEHEKKGVDLFLQTNIKDWVGVDVKSSLTGVLESKAKHPSKSEKKPVTQVIKSTSFQGEPSYRQPIIRVTHNGNHFILNVDYGLEGKLPMVISPPDYRNFDREVATELTEKLLEYLRSQSSEVALYDQMPDHSFRRRRRDIGHTAIKEF